MRALIVPGVSTRGWIRCGIPSSTRDLGRPHHWPAWNHTRNPIPTSISIWTVEESGLAPKAASRRSSRNLVQSMLVAYRPICTIRWQLCINWTFAISSLIIKPLKNLMHIKLISSPMSGFTTHIICTTVPFSWLGDDHFAPFTAQVWTYKSIRNFMQIESFPCGGAYCIPKRVTCDHVTT